MRKTLHLSDFEATLNTDWANARNNAELTLTLRLGFRQVNPAGTAATGVRNDAGGNPRAIRRWTAASWRAWKATFARTAERYWHGRFWILNGSGKFAIRSGPTVFVPNVWCRFDLIAGDANVGGHHHVIEVVRLAESETFFGSNTVLFDNLDIEPVQKGVNDSGSPIMQRAHVHEVGHLLGLPHVDVGKPHCLATGDTNASACYGVTDVDQNSVMGQGMRLDAHHGLPWLTAWNRFVQAEPVSPLYRPARGTVRRSTVGLRRQYPRTADEFERNTQVLRPVPGR